MPIGALLRCNAFLVSGPPAGEANVACQVKIFNHAGHAVMVPLKKGTQVVDGLWPEMRGAIPDSVHSSDWPRCQSYIWAWIWRMRRPGMCLISGIAKCTLTFLREVADCQNALGVQLRCSEQSPRKPNCRRRRKRKRTTSGAREPAKGHVHQYILRAPMLTEFGKSLGGLRSQA